MAVRVYIGTTEGPSEVQRVTLEDPKVRSVICLGGKTIALPIARRYDSFVRDPTGIIEKYFGHPAYRIDVSTPIEVGNSWQLGVFAAHALFARDRLARPDEAADRAIWLTGEVDRALHVGPVAHIEEKISRSKDLFEALGREGIPLTIYAARKNAETMSDAWIARRGIDPARCRVASLDDVEALCRDLDLPSLGPQNRTREKPQTPSRRYRPLVWISGAVAAFLAFFGLFALTSGLPDWVDLHRSARIAQLNESLDDAVAGGCISCGLFARGFRVWLDTRRPDPETIALAIFEIRTPPGQPCPKGDAGQVRLAPVVKDKQGQLKPSAISGLCALVFEVANRGRPAHVWAFAQAVPDRTYLLADRSALSDVLRPSARTQRWSVRPPEGIAAPLRYQFVALASEDPLAASVEWMLRKLFRNRAHPFAKDWVSVVRDLNRRGITVVSVRHELTP